MRKSKHSGGFKSMPCRECGEIVEKVDEQATSVKCWRCVSFDVRKLEESEKENKRTRN